MNKQSKQIAWCAFCQEPVEFTSRTMDPNKRSVPAKGFFAQDGIRFICVPCVKEAKKRLDESKTCANE